MYLRPLLHNLRRNTCSQLSQMCCNPPMYIRPVVISSTSTHLTSKVRLASSTSTIQPTNNAEEIYYGTLTPKIRAVKVFSLTTSVVGVSIQPMLIEQGTKLGGMPMVVFMCGFAGLFTFVTPVLLHFVTKKYVTHITYNSANDEYTATTISLLLLRKQVKQFRIIIIIPNKHLKHSFPIWFNSTSSRHQTSMCPTSPACSPHSR